MATLPFFEVRVRLQRIVNRLNALAVLYPKIDSGAVSVGNLVLRDDEIGLFLQVDDTNAMILGAEDAQIVFDQAVETNTPSPKGFKQ